MAFAAKQVWQLFTGRSGNRKAAAHRFALAALFGDRDAQKLAEECLRQFADFWMRGDEGGERTAIALDDVVVSALFDFGQTSQLAQQDNRVLETGAQFARRETPLRGKTPPGLLHNFFTLLGGKA